MGSEPCRGQRPVVGLPHPPRRRPEAPKQRYIAPLARLPRVEAWPEADQAAWKRALRKPGPLEPPGRLAHLTPVSVNIIRAGWARFLTFLSVSGELVDLEGPADRLTPDRTGRFIRSMKGHLSPLSVVHAIYSLFHAITAMVPDRDWRFVCNHPERPRNREVQFGRKAIFCPDPVALLAGALDYCDAAETSDGSVVARATAFRDGLIVAFDTYLMARRKNLAEIRIGEHLIVENRGIRLVLDSTVKNGEIIDSWLPKMLEWYMRRYLDYHRRNLLQGYPDIPGLWITSIGHQLNHQSYFRIFQRVGERVIGRGINVHSVRYAMATTTLDDDPHDIELASAGLAHVGTSSVALTYDKGGPARANRAYQAILKRRRSRRNT
jgi:hypothetical protein